MNVINFLRNFLLLLVLYAVCHSLRADVLEPPMVLVPAGEYKIGSHDFEDTTPLKTLTINAFWVGKFEVTRAEFAEFIKDTNYDVPQQCYHEIGYWWFEQESAGDWQNNAINSNMYEPVSCIGYEAAMAYASWLAQKTGKPYRLLSEAEWEYLAENFKNDSQSSVCERANIADLRGESVAQSEFGTSYVNLIGIESCDDKSGTVSIVGAYKPNKLGVHDLTGNVNEFVADCYTPDYSQMPHTGSAVISKESPAQCDAVVLRGGAWHWPAWSNKIRDAKPRDWVGVLEGFRLAMSVASNAEIAEIEAGIGNYYSEESTQLLTNAIEKALSNTKPPVSLPSAVSNLALNTDDKGSNKLTLTWQGKLNQGARFVILSNKYMGGRFSIEGYSDVSSYVIDKPAQDSHQYPHQYVVAIQQDKVMGPYSSAIDIGVVPTPLPSTLQAERFSSMDNALVFPFDVHNSFVTGPLRGTGDIVLHYEVSVPASGSYTVRLNGQAGAPVQFAVQQQGKPVGNAVLGNAVLGDAVLDKETGVTFSVQEGNTTLTLSTSQGGWQLDSIDINSVNTAHKQ